MNYERILQTVATEDGSGDAWVPLTNTRLGVPLALPALPAEPVLKQIRPELQNQETTLGKIRSIEQWPLVKTDSYCEEIGVATIC